LSSVRFSFLVVTLPTSVIWAQASSPPMGSPASAHPIAVYQSMSWRNIGPFRGGRADAVAGVTSEAETFYLGTSGGGIYQTTNGGQRWTNISDGFLKTSSVGAIAVAPSDPNVIYAGMGENTARNNMISEGDGIYKSTDAGRTWRQIGLEATRVISRVRIHPSNPDLVYVAAQGSEWAPSPDRGVYRSRDGGATWKKVLFVSESSGPSDLAMDPANPRILYAAFWDHQRKPWFMRSGGPESGIYKTLDGGDSWQKLESKLPALMGKIAIAVSADHNRLYALIEASKGGLYRSDDAGKTWKLVNPSDSLMSRPYYYTKIYADPANPDVAWVQNQALLKTEDGGARFTAVETPHSDTHDLWINPLHPNSMAQADDGGGTISRDGGRTWSTEDNQATGQFYRVNTDDGFPYRVYGGQQDDSSVAIASWANGRGIGSGDWFKVGGCESAYVAFNPKDPALIYSDCYLGQLDEFDMRTRSARSVMAYPQVPMATPLGEIKYRFNWNAPLLVSRHEGNVIYHAAQKLLRSDDRGHTWREISPDLTQPTPQTQGDPGGPFWSEGTGGEIYDTIFYIAESPLDRNILWAGTDDGLLQLTRDGGKTWRKFALPGLPDAQMNAIEASWHDPATAYVAATRYRLGDNTPYLYKTTNYGETWEKIVDGLPADSWSHVIREDPARKDLLYAGTDTGAWVSFNGGKHWDSLQQNLPNTPVTDLQVHGTDLVAATGGRAFWILDDIAPLRRLDPPTIESTAYLFEPRPAIRTVLGSADPLTSDPPREWSPLGENPPSGAVLDFFLPRQIPASLEIVDAQGRMVRRFSSDASSQDPASALRVKPGMNRLVWNLRYQAVKGIPGAGVFRHMGGRLAAPGRYQVRLTVAGRTYAVPLEVLADPRVGAAPEKYAEQDQFLSGVEHDISELYQAVLRIRSVREQLQATQKRAADPAIEQAAADLIAKLTTLENALIQTKATGIHVIAEPARLDSHFNFLHFAANSWDPGITAGDRAVYADISKEWAKDKAQLEQILGRELSAFNRLYVARGLDTVIVPK
jgi:photosystem II stability/assembly factor-like uncharacterized protein